MEMSEVMQILEKIATAVEPTEVMFVMCQSQCSDQWHVFYGSMFCPES